ncbi:MAG: hypothetical protein QW320_11575, partial [Ignisphaera sp.]
MVSDTVTDAEPSVPVVAVPALVHVVVPDVLYENEIVFPLIGLPPLSFNTAVSLTCLLPICIQKTRLNKFISPI